MTESNTTETQPEGVEFTDGPTENAPGATTPEGQTDAGQDIGATVPNDLEERVTALENTLRDLGAQILDEIRQLDPGSASVEDAPSEAVFRSATGHNPDEPSDDE